MPRTKKLSLTGLSEDEKKVYHDALIILNEQLDKKIAQERPELEEFFRQKNVPLEEIESRIRKHKTTLYNRALALFHKMDDKSVDPFIEAAEAKIEAKKPSINKF